MTVLNLKSAYFLNKQTNNVAMIDDVCGSTQIRYYNHDEDVSEWVMTHNKTSIIAKARKSMNKASDRVRAMIIIIITSAANITN